ncbi:apolipoprotein N-acyltransferase [Acetobacter sp.]|uniref:apolipoprotein N-acyltransferase n=1 Tax=Acetobacter sp. TaxID=440 RepID=UPI0039EA26EB
MNSPSRVFQGRLRLRKPSRASLRHTFSLLGLGALSALALPPVHALPVLLITFPILGAVLNRSTNWKSAAWAGALFGFGLYAASLYWLVNAVMIRAEDFWWFVPFPSLGCALILAPMTAAPAALSLLAKSGPRRLILFAASWTVFDMGRVFLFSGFPWNPLGSALAIPGPVGDVLIQPAAWMGVDGMTLCVVLLSLMAGTALQDYWHRARKTGTVCFSPLQQRITLGLSAIMVIGWGAAGYIRLHTVRPTGEAGPITVLVQGNVPENEKVAHQSARDVFERYLSLTAQGIERAHALQTSYPNRAIVFLWPETAYPGYPLLQDSPRARQIIMGWAEGAQAGLIGALRHDEEGRYRNSVLALGPDGRVEAIYDKARLVPFGEYQPSYIPLQIVPQGGLAAGPGPHTWHLADVPSVGALICYEVIFSGSVVDEKNRPHWLANVTNDAWFGNSAGPRQHLSSVRLRAVEEGLPIARAANTGISIAYDGFGHELARLGWDKTDSLVVPLPAPLPAPLFSLCGRVIALALCCVVVIAAYSPRRKQV